MFYRATALCTWTKSKKLHVPTSQITWSYAQVRNNLFLLNRNLISASLFKLTSVNQGSGFVLFRICTKNLFLEILRRIIWYLKQDGVFRSKLKIYIFGCKKSRIRRRVLLHCNWKKYFYPESNCPIYLNMLIFKA